MVRACSHGEVRRVKNRAFARIGQVMDAVVVAFATRGQEDSRRHLVPCEKDRVVQVVDAAANPYGIACGNHLIRFVECRERFVLCACRIVASVGRHVVHGAERLSH